MLKHLDISKKNPYLCPVNVRESALCFMSNFNYRYYETQSYQKNLIHAITP